MIPRSESHMSDEDWNALKLEAEIHFTPGTAIKEKDLFAGRMSQIEKLSQRVRLAGSHAVVYGERGVGKSSLVNIFKHVADSSPQSVQYIRVAATDGDDFRSIFYKVFKRISITEDDKKFQLSELYENKDITPDDVLLELEGFSKNVIPIIVLDEYDTIVESREKTKISDTIKLLSDEGSAATIIIVGVADSVSDLLTGHGSIGRALAEIEMPRMSDSEIISIIVDRMKLCGMKIDEDALWDCVFICKGLPHFAHLIGLHAAQTACDDKTLMITGKEMQEATKRTLTESNRSLKEKFEKGIYSERSGNLFASVLVACALAKKDTLGMFNAKQISAVLKETTGEDYEPPAFAYHLNEFCSDDRGRILKKFGKTRQFKYRFNEALLEPHIILEGLKRGIISAKLVKKHKPTRQNDLFSSIER